MGWGSGLDRVHSTDVPAGTWPQGGNPMMRTRSTARPSSWARSVTTWRRTAAGCVAGAVSLALVACAAPSTPSGSASAPTSSPARVTGFSAAWIARAESMANDRTPAPPGKDVSAATLKSSKEIAALNAAVAGWASPCGATSVVETFVVASQASLEKGHWSAARGVLQVADKELRLRQRQGLVTPARADWFHSRVTAILAAMPGSGSVISKAGFPEVQRILRCSGQSSSATPTVAAPSLMLAATTSGGYEFNVPSSMDAIHTLLTTGIEVGAALGPEGAAADVAAAIVVGLVDLFWPSDSADQPKYVTFQDMSNYVDSEINKATGKIMQTIDANQLAAIDNDLVGLKDGIAKYEQDLAAPKDGGYMVASPTSFGGYTDASRTRAFTDMSELDGDFIRLRSQFTGFDKSYLNLPETINFFTLWLTFLRSWIVSADEFSENADTAANFRKNEIKEFNDVLGYANAAVTDGMPKLEAAIPVQSKSPMAQGWNKTWSFMDIMYQAGYNQVFLWKSLDPTANPPDKTTGAFTMPVDRTVVATPCLGGYSEPDGNGGFVAADPASVLEPLRTSATAGPAGVVPLRNLLVTGDHFGTTGVQEYWGTAVKQTSGTLMTLTMHHVVPFNTTPWTWALSASILYNAEHAYAPGVPSIGGLNELQLNTTTSNPTDKDVPPVMTTGPWMVGSNGFAIDPEQTFSLKGYTLAWVAMAGQRRTPQTASAYDADGGGNDQCMALGFRLLDSYNIANPYPNGT